MTNLVKIEKFNTLNEDERGLTSQFSLPRKQDDFIFLTRKIGSESGNTYHEGKNSGTSPKTFLLLSGTIDFSYRKTGDKTVYSESISAPSKIMVQPLVTHKVMAKSDFIMLECNSILDIQNDKHRENV